jgi:hypothetical protein
LVFRRRDRDGRRVGLLRDDGFVDGVVAAYVVVAAAACRRGDDPCTGESSGSKEVVKRAAEVLRKQPDARRSR